MFQRSRTLIRDRELLSRFRKGQRAALEKVFRHYAPMVTAFLRSGFMYSTSGQSTRFPGVSSTFELEETLQEVFQRALTEKTRLGYDGLRPYGGFLIGIARNIVLDELRKRARRGEVIEPAEIVEVRAAAVASAAASSSSFEESLDQIRRRELVQRFLKEECDDKDRALYLLRYEEDLSQQESGRRAKLTRIQVRRWETKFRARLLRFLMRADYVRSE